MNNKDTENMEDKMKKPECPICESRYTENQDLIGPEYWECMNCRNEFYYYPPKQEQEETNPEKKSKQQKHKTI